MAEVTTGIGPDDGGGSPCRALVATAPPARVHPVSPATRPAADFVAQLIACEHRLPPFRRAGRIDPATGTRSYGAHPVAARAALDLVV